VTKPHWKSVAVSVFFPRCLRRILRIASHLMFQRSLRTAVDFNRAVKSLEFVQGDLRSLDLGMQFDVIICAEVLYYILPKDVAKANRNLDKYLAPHGIIVLVSGFQLVRRRNAF